MTEEIVQLVQLTALVVTMLLPLANPLTAVSMLLSMDGSMPRTELLRQLRQGAFYVVLIILVTYFVGTWIIHALDISLPGIRIAGGMIVAFIGFNMLFPTPVTLAPAPSGGPGSGSSKPQDVPNIAFVPLALPGTAGLIGHAGIDAISRIMGFLLVCMGVQLVIDGILEIVREGVM